MLNIYYEILRKLVCKIIFFCKPVFPEEYNLKGMCRGKTRDCMMN